MSEQSAGAIAKGRALSSRIAIAPPRRMRPSRVSALRMCLSFEASVDTRLSRPRADYRSRSLLLNGPAGERYVCLPGTKEMRGLIPCVLESSMRIDREGFHAYDSTTAGRADDVGGFFARDPDANLLSVEKSLEIFPAYGVDSD